MTEKPDQRKYIVIYEPQWTFCYYIIIILLIVNLFFIENFLRRRKIGLLSIDLILAIDSWRQIFVKFFIFPGKSSNDYSQFIMNWLRLNTLQKYNILGFVSNYFYSITTFVIKKKRIMDFCIKNIVYTPFTWTTFYLKIGDL